MRKFTKLFAAAAMAVAFAASANAQEERRRPGGNTTQPPGGGRTGGMMGGGFGSIYGMLATNKALQEEVKITDDQKKKLEEVAKEQQAKMREVFTGGGFGRDMTDEQRKELSDKMAKLQADAKAAYEKVLDEKQAKRVSQINYQNMGTRAFSDKAVQEALKMGDDQKEKIKGIMETYSKESRELMGGFARGGRPSEEDQKKMEENRKKAEALRKETEEKIVATLSSEQQKSWKDMIGEKFDTTKLRPSFGGDRRPRDN